MKAVERLAKRQQNWAKLDQMVEKFSTSLRFSPLQVVQFAALYRAVCADLALADAYQLPPGTISYLHRLVARAHHQLYRAKGLAFRTWSRMFFNDVPRQVLHDRCVQFAFVFFWGLFALAAFMAYRDDLFPKFADDTLGEAVMAQMEEMYGTPLKDREVSERVMMAAFYIQHNTGIGLQCFASCLLLVPGLLVVKFNALQIGAVFGYMARPETAGTENFFEFVTAHGPFELTAVVLSAGAGLRLGVSWMWTRGYSRRDAIRRALKDTLPVMGAAMVLFFGAAFIEGFISPSLLPYPIKGAVAILSSMILVAYFVVLGLRAEASDAV